MINLNISITIVIIIALIIIIINLIIYFYMFINLMYNNSNSSIYYKIFNKINTKKLKAVIDKLERLDKENKKLNEQILLGKKHYDIISNFSDDIIFEFDIANEKILQSKNWGNIVDEIDYIEAITKQKLVHPDDIPTLECFFEILTQTKDSSNIEIRIKLNAEEDYCWYLLHGKAIFLDDGKLLKIVTKAINIDKQKKENEMLKIKAQHDQLTGLYNKETTYNKIENVLKQFSKNTHAIFMFDIDNFKAVNDNFGHLFGDVVLCDVSSKIGKLFRITDILGRVGGDEFLACMRNISDEKAVINRAEEMVNVLRHCFNNNKINCKISGSIGIALYPRDGMTLKELIKNADNALYNAKASGKDCYQVFNSSIPEQHYIEKFEPREYKNKIQSPFKESILKYIFQILYETNDINNVINLILGLIGRYYNVSRSYVFENTKDNLYCNNTFEWCNDGVESQIDKLQNVPYDTLDNYYDNFDENGIFYCRDVNEVKPSLYEVLYPQNIRSMLQCAIINNHEFKGYVGFDECKENRLWTEDEITTLSFVSKILSTFLIKMRMQNELAKSNEIIRSVLDIQDMWTYIIKKETYELLFINKKTCDLVDGISIGDICYKVLMNRDAPCKFCPVEKIANSNNINYTVELYNHVYNIWTSTTVSKMKWKNEETVYLISCSDITKYKME